MVVNSARVFAGLKIGFGERFSGDKEYWDGTLVRNGHTASEALADMFHDPRDYEMGCTNAWLAIMNWAWMHFDRQGFDSGTTDPLRSPLNLVRFSFLKHHTSSMQYDIIPGEHVYLKAGEPLTEKSLAAPNAFEGENMIYLGGGEFFGHPLGVLSWDEGYQEVSTWGTNVPYITEDRWYPRAGLR